MVSAQEYLNKEYPQKERGSITKLKIICQDLEGHLDLRDFVNLEVLYFNDNKLTSINLSKNVNLIELILNNNQLTNIDLSKNTKLENLKLYRNNISADLSIFSHLTNLKILDLGLDDEMFKRGPELNNNFSSSLKSLENLTSLHYLCIGHQPNITEGLEYVPAKNLTHFGCHGTVFEEILKPCGYGHKGLKLWKGTPKNEREQIAKDPTLYLHNRNQLLIQENEDIKKQLESKELEIQELIAELSELETELEQTKLQFLEKSSELELKQQQLAQSQETKIEVICELGKKNVEIKTKNEEISNLKIKEKELVKKESEINNLRTTITQKEQLLTELKKQLETSKSGQTNLNSQISSLKAEIATKQAEINKKENDLKAEFNRERETKLTELKNQHKDEQNKLRDKINTKLPWTQKNTKLEGAIDNLLDKQAKIENIEAEQEAMREYLSRIRERSYRGMFGFFTKSKNLKDEIELWKIEMVANEQHLPTRGEKIREFTGFNWLSNKVGSAYSMAIFAAAVPTILTGLGYLIKSYFKAKSNVVHGTYQVANGMINHGGGNNIPPPYQSLPPAQNHYLPPATPQPLLEATPNPAPIINNHYHTSPVEKKTRKVQKKKTNSS